MRHVLLVAVACVPALLCGCGGSQPELVEAAPGEPLPGLTADEMARFVAGRAVFDREFTPDEGLGPLFNQTRCSSCHDLPTSGGHGAEFVTRATRFDATTGCDLLRPQGGDLLQTVPTPAARAAGLTPERIPQGATAVTEIRPPPLYGLGLMERVPLEQITARADPDDADGDGISGRPGTAADGSTGRFGTKAVHTSIASFIEEAIRGEMGLTTPLNPVESPLQQGPMPEGVDPAPDPEVDEALLVALADYVRFLAPPATAPVTEEEREAVENGRALFTGIGCVDCHTPTWTTGPAESAALNRIRFRAYSDFLLHDLGPELADICAPGAAPSEWRTTPLVGLRLRSIFMHHGEAQNLGTAIDLHGGEAADSRERFRALPEHSRQNLIRFLQSL